MDLILSPSFPYIANIREYYFTLKANNLLIGVPWVIVEHIASQMIGDI